MGGVHENSSFLLSNLLARDAYQWYKEGEIWAGTV